MNTARRFATTILPPVLVFAAVIGAWYFVSIVVLDDTEKFLLPPPHEVLTDGFLDAKIRGDIIAALWVTAKVAIIGMAISITIGLTLAVTMSRAKWVERSLYPG